LTWTDSSPDRTLSIQPTGSTFEYWVAGVKYTTSGDTKQISDVEGVHAIYYDGGTLTETANPTTAQMDSIIRTKALVSIVFWDTSAATAIYVGEERHGKSMSSVTHTYLHFLRGLAYLSGLGLNALSADGAGATADARFGVDAGTVSDEDIYLTIGAVTSTTGLPIYYMLGAGAEWQKHTESGFSVRTSDGTSSTRLAFNEYAGGVWQLTQAANNSFVLCHVFATTEKDNPMIAVMGQAEYTTKKAARAGAQTEIQSLVLDDILFPEIKAVATVIFQTNLSYASAVNARVVSTEEGDDYVDLRNEVISRTTVSTTDHGSLTGLGDDDHTIYTLADGTRAFTGNQSMGSNKLTSLADGVDANDAINKGQLDAQVIADHDTSATGAQLDTLTDSSNADALHVHAHSAATGQTANDHHNELHTIASHSDTTATGAELETLTDSSDADSLHTHSHANTTGQTANDHHNEAHTVASHSDTTATGAELETLTDGSNADSLHVHSEDIATKRYTVTTYTRAGIQTALNALGADGGEVYMPEAEYTLDSTSITIPQNNITLRGAGAGTILKVPNGTNPADLKIIDISTKTDCVLKDFTIDGNQDNNTGQMRAVYISGGSGHKLLNLYLVEIQGTNAGAGGDGIFVDGVPTDCLIQGCTIDDVGDDGMDVNAMAKSRIVGCYVGNCDDNGIDTDGAEYLSISNNTIETCGGHGIELEEEGTGLTQYSTVVGNTIRNITGNAIHIESGGYNSVVANVVETASKGVYLAKTLTGDAAVYNNVVGNTILNCTDGVEEEGSSEANYNSIIENKCYNCTTDVTVSGANTRTQYEGASQVFVFNKKLNLQGVLDNTLTASKPVFTDGSKNHVSTGTLGIDQGGTGQTTQTAAMDALAPTTTKGDLSVHNGSDNVRLPVGANDQILTADSTESSGVKWAVGGGGGAETYLELNDTPVAYDNGKYAKSTAAGVVWDTPAGAGDVVGPASSNDNALAVFDGVTGKLIQDTKDTDTTVYAGRSALGYNGSSSDHAFFGHVDRVNAFEWAVVQDADGKTYVNSATGELIQFLINSTGSEMVVSDGGVRVGESVSAPDSRFEVETEATEGHQAVTIDQNDTDEAFIDYQGDSDTDQNSSISTAQGAGAVDGPKKLSGCGYGWVFEGMVMVEINGAKKWMAYYEIDTGC
jgi:hypothetical protein